MPVDVTFFLSNEYQRKALTCWSATLSPAGVPQVTTRRIDNSYCKRD